MKLIKTFIIAAITLSVTACSVFKKSKTQNTTTAEKQATSPADKNTGAVLPFLDPKPANGIYTPGEAELTAIQVKYPSTQMQTLREGHGIYTGVCTNCHEAQSIYSRPTEAWPAIIDDMGDKARLTGPQKDAVLKYVMAIKATQAK